MRERRGKCGDVEEVRLRRRGGITGITVLARPEWAEVVVRNRCGRRWKRAAMEPLTMKRIRGPITGRKAKASFHRWATRSLADTAAIQFLARRRFVVLVASCRSQEQALAVVDVLVLAAGLDAGLPADALQQAQEHSGLRAAEPKVPDRDRIDREPERSRHHPGPAQRVSESRHPADVAHLLLGAVL